MAQQIFQLLRVFGTGGGKDRHEGVGKTALGEETAQRIGNAQRGVEGIGHHDVKIARDQHVAQQAEDAREQRHHGKNGRGATE